MTNFLSSHPPQFTETDILTIYDGWMAIYEIWSLSSLSIILKLSINLPKSDILSLFHWQVKNGHQFQQCRFEFPVAFAGDLRTVFILSSLISLRSVPSPDLSCDFVCSFLDPWSTTGHQCEILECYPYSYRTLLSPSGKHMLLLRPAFEKGRRDISLSERWDFEIYWDWPDNGIMESKAVLSIQRYDIPFEFNQLHTLGLHFKFHPFLPCLALALKSRTLLWQPSALGKLILYPPPQQNKRGK